MNQDASALKVKEIEPGSRLDLAQARNAVELARLAGADRFAAETFDKAVKQLAVAEEARERRRGGNEIMMPARQAAQTAEDARLVGLQRQEEAYQAEQRALALTENRTHSAAPKPRKPVVVRPRAIRRQPQRRATPLSVTPRRQQPLASPPSAIPRQRQRPETRPSATAPRPMRPSSRQRPRARRQRQRSGQPKRRRSRRRAPRPSPNVTRSCCEDSFAISSTSSWRRVNQRAA